MILGVLVFGIGWNLRQVLVLRHEVAWIELPVGARARMRRAAAAAGADGVDAARRSGRLSLSAIALRSVLDGIPSRLDETRELSRYMIGLLIFLGLLGTFWGLLLTIGSVGDVIGDLSVGSGDLNALFNQLKPGLHGRWKGWGRRSRPRCSASPARWCWASSISRRARRRTASPTSWRNGCRG